jgi:hypothetical protein
MTEAKTQAEIRIAASKLGARLFRNSKGVFYTKDLQRQVEAGLIAPGSSDLIGWTKVKITSEMVGETVAVFTAIEVKKRLPRNFEHCGTEDQRNFILQLREAGGIASFCDDANNLKKLLQWCKISV